MNISDGGGEPGDILFYIMFKSMAHVSVYVKPMNDYSIHWLVVVSLSTQLKKPFHRLVGSGDWKILNYALTNYS